MKVRILLLITVLFLSNSVLFSQWSSDPNVNTLICNVNNAQLLPKTAVTSTGETYITWFDNRSGNLDVYMQRLDANGNKQFAPNGLLVSSNPQNSWIGDYDIEVDSDNNLIIVFSDKRNAGGADTTVNPYAYKISPTGTFLWGANGVALSNTTSTYQLWPTASISSDGSIFVTWWEEGTNTSSIYTQKLNSNGVLQWANPYIIPGVAPDKNIYPNNAPSDNGSVLITWCFGPQGGGSFVPDIKTIFVRKVSGAGSPVWTDSIFSRPDPDIPPYVVPQVVPDGNNGAYFSWYYSRNLNVLTCGVQRISSAGTLSFPANGVEVSTNANQNQVEPYMTFDQSGNIYSFWRETNTMQSFYGLSGQKISPAGNRMWSDTGLTITPLSDSTAPLNMRAGVYNNNVFVTFVRDTANNDGRIYGYSLDGNGNILWGPNSISTVASLKYDMVSAVTPSGMSVYVWSDNRNSGNNGTGVWAQNVKPDGSLGPVGIIQISSEIPDRYSLAQNYPNPFNPSTKINFSVTSPGVVKLTVMDMLGREISTLVNSKMEPGTYNVDFDGAGLTSGVYFYRLETGSFVETKRMVLLK